MSISSGKDHRNDSSSSHTLSVLLVEDNHDIAMTFVDVLELLGHYVTWADSAKRALALAPALEPELILLDIGLPDLNGFELATRLRALALPPCHIVAVTGWGSPADHARSHAASIDEHVVKPVPLDRLLAILAAAPRRRRSYRAIAPAAGIAV